jgi:serine/threonine-protein kinase HipA
MFEPIKVVGVFYRDRRVGRLALTPDHQCVFEYEHEWLTDGFSISPFYLPLKYGLFAAKADPFNGLFGVFADSLPDGWSKLLMDRWLMSMGIQPFKLSVLDWLCLVGSGGMGALAYKPDHSFEKEETTMMLDFYSAEVEKILHEDYSGSLDTMVSKAGSSGGARPKVLVNIEDKDWLVKFRSSVDPPDVGKIEYEHSLLAKKCGIEMPETRLFNEKYFGSRRFDIEENNRIHVHSAAGLLYASHRLPSLDYTSLMKATFALTRNMNEVARMFRLMVFNVLIGNMDDHSRNFSFIYSGSEWKISPAYDLLPGWGFNGNHSTTINGKGRPSLSDCLEVAKLSSFPEKKAKDIIEEVSCILRAKPK